MEWESVPSGDSVGNVRSVLSEDFDEVIEQLPLEECEMDSSRTVSSPMVFAYWQKIRAVAVTRSPRLNRQVLRDCGTRCATTSGA